jgi:hypothetical protein
MRAQSVRKTIGLVNAALLLAGAGAAAWYVLEVKPALAAGAKPKEWLDAAYKQYVDDKGKLTPAVIFPITEEELKEIRRPDLVKEAGVWAYVGPVPVPLPKKETVDAAAPPPPEGIDALGKLYLAIVHAGEKPSMVAWKFNSGKMGYFSEGEFVAEGSDKKRFKLVDVLQPDPKAAIVKLVYDVHDDPEKPPIERKTSGPYDLSRKNKPDLIRLATPAGTAAAGPGEGTAPAPAPAAGPGAPAPGPVGVTPVPVRIEELRPVIRRSGNEVAIEFDESSYEGYKKVTIEDVMREVRTEDVKDSRTGQPAGVRIADTGGVAASFDVQRGDILKSINGTPVRNRDEAVKVVKALPKETTVVTVVIERNGSDRIYKVDPRDPKVRAAANKLRVGR